MQRLIYKTFDNAMHAIQLYIQYTMQFIAIKKFEALKTLSNCFVMLHYTFCFQ